MLKYPFLALYIMAQPMTYRDGDGNTYKISYSEELQLKNLHATKEQTFWLRKNFYMMLLLGVMFALFVIAVFSVLYWVDAHNIISRLLAGR